MDNLSLPRKTRRAFSTCSVTLASSEDGKCLRQTRSLPLFIQPAYVASLRTFFFEYFCFSHTGTMMAPTAIVFYTVAKGFPDTFLPLLRVRCLWPVAFSVDTQRPCERVWAFLKVKFPRDDFYWAEYNGNYIFGFGTLQWSGNHLSFAYI